MKTWILAKQTLQEGIRDRILWGGLVGSLILIFLGVLASKIPFSHQNRILIDFSFSAYEMTLIMTGLLLGATSISRDIERRTLFLILSKPISRSEFYVGRYLGFSALLAILAGIAGGVQTVLVSLFTGGIPAGWFISLLTLWMESVLVCGFGLLFSVYSSRALALTQGAGVILIALNFQQIRFLVTKMEPGFERNFLIATTKVLPDFSFFHYGTKVIYEIPIETLEWVGAVAYFGLWFLILILVGTKLFSYKNI